MKIDALRILLVLLLGGCAREAAPPAPAKIPEQVVKKTPPPKDKSAKRTNKVKKQSTGPKLTKQKGKPSVTSPAQKAELEKLGATVRGTISVSFKNKKLTNEAFELLREIEGLLLDLDNVVVDDWSVLRHLQLTSITFRSLELPKGTLKSLEGKKLSRINVYGQVYPGDVEDLQLLKELTTLHLHNTPLTAQGLVIISKIPGLSSLCLSGCEFDDVALEPICGLENLWSLALPATPFECSAGLQRLQKLKRLYLGQSKATDAAVESLGSLENLEAVYLDGTKVTDIGMSHIASLPKLEVLQLSDTSVGDKGLSFIGKLTRLKHLHLRNTLVTDDGLVHLNALPSLRHLDLSDTKISDGGIKHIAQLSGLRDLKLARTKITDTAVCEHLGSLGNLSTLDIRETKVTDRIKLMTTFKRLRNLEF